jgi:hypothetical protein
MENEQLKKSLLAVCKLLKIHNVSYMLVGGAAVALNGYFRNSISNTGEITDKPDIDVWYEPTYTNYFNVLKVMKELGHDTTEFENEQSPNPRKSFFKLDFDDFTFDLLPEIKISLGFNEVYMRKETVKIEDTIIHFMSFSDLIKDKEATGRNKDIEDIERLKNIKK